MLCEANQPTYFWAEEINTICYTENRTLINKFYGSTPYFLLTARKPIVNYFHVFGSKCFMMKYSTEIKGNLTQNLVREFSWVTALKEQPTRCL